MKKLFSILPIAYKALVICCVFTMSGCCSMYVSELGESRAALIGEKVSQTQDGRIVIEANLVRKKLSDYHGEPMQLGKRYIILNAPHEKAFTGGRNHHNVERVFTVDVRCQKFIANPEKANLCQSWYLYPNDILTPIDITHYPPFWSSSSSNAINFSSESCKFTWATGDSEVRLSLNLMDALREHRHYEHTSPWLLPVKAVLFLPALALDVFSFPVQFVYCWSGYFDVGVGPRR